MQVVLLRYSNQEEVTIGVPTAGRQQPETHPLIGYFVNPLPIR
jgi:non-ribosomal peptide synthetase component F